MRRRLGELKGAVELLRDKKKTNAGVYAGGEDV